MKCFEFENAISSRTKINKVNLNGDILHTIDKPSEENIVNHIDIRDNELPEQHSDMIEPSNDDGFTNKQTTELNHTQYKDKDTGTKCHLSTQKLDFNIKHINIASPWDKSVKNDKNTDKMIMSYDSSIEGSKNNFKDQVKFHKERQLSFNVNLDRDNLEKRKLIYGIFNRKKDVIQMKIHTKNKSPNSNTLQAKQDPGNELRESLGFNDNKISMFNQNEKDK